MYFVYDIECGFQIFDTKEEAKESAEYLLGKYRDTAEEGEWDNITEYLCWGKIEQKATQKDDGFEYYLDRA